MDKKKFTIVRFDQKALPNGNKSVKDDVLVAEKWLRHLENEEFRLHHFASGRDHAVFTFTYQTYKLKFMLDYIVDTLILDFDGAGLPEVVRIKASELLEGVVTSLRFRYKYTYWSLSHYYIADKAQYEARKNPEYPMQFEADWKKIAHLAKREEMEDSDRLFMEVEDIHDLELNIVGEDGKILCSYLEELGLITYKATHENQYRIEFLDAKSDLETINRKIVFAREVAQYGYNIWVDYTE